jgi:hypothetical protein
MTAAAEDGKIEAARELLAELELRTEEFEDFRETLAPAEIFLAMYNVEVIHDHVVSPLFVRQFHQSMGVDGGGG